MRRHENCTARSSLRYNFPDVATGKWILDWNKLADDQRYVEVYGMQLTKPLDASSMKHNCDPPTNAIASCSFLCIPPLKLDAAAFAFSSISHSLIISFTS